MNGKSYLIYLGIAVVLFGSGYFTGVRLHDNAGTIARMEELQRAADANNKRLADENAELKRIGSESTKELARAKGYIEELEGKQREADSLADAIDADNRATSEGLDRAAEINRRTKNLIGEVEKTGK